MEHQVGFQNGTFLYMYMQNFYVESALMNSFVIWVKHLVKTLICVEKGDSLSFLPWLWQWRVGFPLRTAGEVTIAEWAELTLVLFRSHGGSMPGVIPASKPRDSDEFPSSSLSLSLALAS